MSTPSTSSDVQVRPRTQEKPETRKRHIPPYHVIVENDDYHSFEFVVAVIRKAFGYAEERAYQLTMLAHRSGRAVVWTGPKEVAELKAEQVRTHHEIRAADGAKLGPVRCVIEPAPAG